MNKTPIILDNFEMLTAPEPIRKYSRRLDIAMRELGLTKRQIRYDLDVTKEFENGDPMGAIVCICGIHDTTGVEAGAYIELMNLNHLKVGEMQDLILNQIKLDMKAKGLIHNDKS